MLRRVMDWASGFFVASGLWLIDEILTFSRYCGPNCLYPIPLLGSWTQYNVESLAWVMIIGGIGFLMRKEKK